MFRYTYDAERWEIREQKNGDDYEIWLKPLTEERKQIIAMEKAVRRFEDNDVYTDVLVYRHPKHHCQIIVRPDYYAAFFLGLLEYRIIDSFAWE